MTLKENITDRSLICRKRVFGHFFNANNTLNQTIWELRKKGITNIFNDIFRGLYNRLDVITDGIL